MNYVIKNADDDELFYMTTARFTNPIRFQCAFGFRQPSLSYRLPTEARISYDSSRYRYYTTLITTPLSSGVYVNSEGEPASEQTFTATSANSYESDGPAGFITEIIPDVEALVDVELSFDVNGKPVVTGVFDKVKLVRV